MLKKLFEATIFLAGLGLLLWLGYWQLQRAEWKQDIIDKLDREYRKDASAYTMSVADLSRSDEFKVVRGTVQGRFLKGGTTLWPRFLNGKYGFQLVDALLLADGNVLMVNRGWVPQKSSGEYVPAAYYLPRVDVTYTVIGTARELETNPFTLENLPEDNTWHRFNQGQLAEYLNVNYVYPVMMFAEEIPGSKKKVLANLSGRTIYPRNKHNQYAIFWFTLAGLWILILAPLLFRRNYMKTV